MVTDYSLALAMEADVLMSRGLIRQGCGCTKFIQCPFPNVSWYYTTICPHEEGEIYSIFRGLTPVSAEWWPTTRDFWWYDLALHRNVFAREFMERYIDEMWEQEGEFLRTRAGAQLYYIGRGGQVRKVTTWIGGGMAAAWR
jgi:hypothetical protein